MDQSEIIELEIEEMPDYYQPQTIDITPKPKMTWEEFEELYNQIEEDENI